MSKPLKGFITYSHEDTKAKNELRKRLAVMEQQNELVTWDDGQLTPGDQALQEDILEKVADSDLLLYLVSAASLASTNCNKELTAAIKENKRVIPIILEHCHWLLHPIKDFEVLPDKGKPLSEWQPVDKGWQNVVDGIWKTVRKMHTQSTQSEEDQPQSEEDQHAAENAFQLGNFLMMLEQDDKAIEVYSDAIRLNPRDPRAYNQRGLLYYKKGEFENALRDLDEAIEWNSKSAEYYIARSMVYKRTKEYRLALADCTKAIELDDENAMCFYARGSTYSLNNEHELALADYNHTIELNPNYPEIYYIRGLTYRVIGNYNQAIRDFDKSIGQNSSPDLSHYYRAEAWLHLRELEKAKADLVTAKNLGLDITTIFHDEYPNVTAYEQKIGIQLPPDIAALLTPP